MPENLIPSQTQVEQDTLCTHCGYNVRGLYVAGRCPECGTDVALSLRGDLLQYADAHWLDQLRFGVKLSLWNIVLVFVSGVISSYAAATGLSVIVTLLGLAGGGMGLWATFLITMQEPRIGLTEDPVTLRKFVRGCALFTFVGGLLFYSPDVQRLGSVFYFFSRVVNLAGYASSICVMIYLRRFALRIPDEALALSTKRLMWSGILVVVLLFIFSLFTAVVLGTIAPGTTPGTIANSSIWMGFGCITMIAMLVLFLWYVRLLMKYKDAFEVAGSVARGEVSE